MTKQEKDIIRNKKTIAYYSGYSGIEIKEIWHGINDAVVFVSEAWAGKGFVHRAKIHYGKRPYFNFEGNRIYLDECITT